MMPCLTAFSTMGCLHFLHFPLPVKACSTLGDSLLFSVLILVYILYLQGIRKEARVIVLRIVDTAKKEGRESHCHQLIITTKQIPYLNQKHHAIPNTKTL